MEKKNFPQGKKKFPTPRGKKKFPQWKKKNFPSKNNILIFINS